MKRRTGVLIAGLVAALVILGLLLAISDLAALRERVRALHWGWVAAAAATAVLSHLCIAGGQRALLAALGRDVPALLMVRASLVAIVVSRSVRSGGASGVAFLAWVLGRHGVPARLVTSMALGQLLLTNAVFAGLVTLSLAVAAAGTALGSAPMSSRALGLHAVAAGVLVGALVVAWSALARDGPRIRWGRRVERAAGRVGRVLKRPAMGVTAREGFDEAALAVRGMMTDGRSSRAAWAWAVARVSSSLATLWLCALACGLSLPPDAIVLAYVAGKLAATISLVPGGLGAVEGTLVGVLAAFGAPVEAALLVALLNRTVYHVLPTALALALGGPLLRSAALEPPP